MPVPEVAFGHRHGGSHADPQDRLSVELRRATADDHQRLEQILRLPDRIVDAPSLTRILLLWVRLWSDVAVPAPLDGAAAARPEPDELPVIALRALTRLATDLQELDVVAEHATTAPTPSGRPRQPLPAVVPCPEWVGGPLNGLRSTVPGCWGVEYVLRGTLIGGRTLAPVITRHLRLPEGVGVHYLSAEGEDAGRGWADFRHRLDEWAESATPQQCLEVVDAAAATFAIVQGWAQELAGEAPSSGPSGPSGPPVPRPRTAP